MPRISLAPGWPRWLAFTLPPLLALALLAAAVLAGTAPPGPDPSAAAAAVRAVAVPPPAGLLVYVSGAVVHPGIYRMRRGDRLYAAIQAAGGLLTTVDPAKLPDMAQRLRDGQQVKVAYLKGRGPTAGTSTSAKVDINQATLDELLTVPGFTQDIAQAAIDYRTNYGGFAATKELMTVLGMDFASFQAAKAYIKV